MSSKLWKTITVDCKDLEDNILIKSDGMPTYNFANVVDDHLMGINYVIRGVEYLSSTPKYNLLYKAFGWEIPNYMHLQPIMKDATRKLSKRYGDASYADFIKRGFLKEALKTTAKSLLSKKWYSFSALTGSVSLRPFSTK